MNYFLLSARESGELFLIPLSSSQLESFYRGLYLSGVDYLLLCERLYRRWMVLVLQPEYVSIADAQGVEDLYNTCSALVAAALDDSKVSAPFAGSGE